MINFKKINRFFDRISHDIVLFNIKPSLLIGAITLLFGVLSWIVGGRADKVVLIYIFPRSAMPLGIMFFLWAVSFFVIGITIGGILFGCEKYKRREAGKITVLLIISIVFTLCVYPIFFKAMAPFIASLVLLISALFCFFAILSSIKIYSLWTIVLFLHTFWLLYNGFLALTIALIN